MSLFSERERQRLSDIVDNADAIAEYIAGFDAAAFGTDRKTVDAVERCLMRISEAVVHIGAARMALVSPTLSEVDVRGLGNFLRHEYYRVDLLTIYNTAAEDVPALRASCVAALER